MQRFASALFARSFALGPSQRCLRGPVVMFISRRGSSSAVPPSTPVRPPTTAGRAHSDASAHEAQAMAPELDAKAAEQVRLAQDIGEQAFGENTEILKQIGYRGLRAFVVCVVGLSAFMWAMKKKKAELAAQEAAKADDDDPTQRYLEEMRGLGFDVDTLEEELEQERVAKLAAKKAAKSAV